MNKIKCEKIVSDEQTRQERENPPVTAVLIEKSNRTDRDTMANETTLSKQEQQTIKNIISSICEPSTSSPMDSQSDNEMCERSTIEFAHKPPMETPMCHSIDQMESLQNNGIKPLQLILRPMTLSRKLFLSKRSASQQKSIASLRSGAKILDVSVWTTTKFST